MPEYTVVIGVDARNLEKLNLVLPTWRLHKPSLFRRSWVVFVDGGEALGSRICSLLWDVDHLNVRFWPEQGVTYPEGDGSKWKNPQRYKMLAGFVHVPALCVHTKYWLKIDLDVTATGQDDWVDDAWFANDPAIVAPSWGYTKPADQMLKLDEWVANNSGALPALAAQPPLGIAPAPGASMVHHKRIASWCGFFHTEFTRRCASMAERTCGVGKLPVPSQDGFLWYMAARMQFPITTAAMKARGWDVRNSVTSITAAVRRACGGA